MLIINDEIKISLDEIRFSFVRSSGPGGQNVNKVASKAVLRWNFRQSGLLSEKVVGRLEKLYPARLAGKDEIILSSQRTRDALKNKNDCLEKLRAMIQHALEEPKERIPTKTPRRSVERRLDNKARQSKKKKDRKDVDY